MPIKFTIGDFFLTEIETQLYCFEIDHAAIKTYRGTGLRSIRYLNYDTTHYRPISEKVKELELILKKNSLPKVNNLLSNVFKVLGQREKEEFTTHSLLKLIENLEDEYGEQAKNIVIYLKELGLDEIVTPLRGVSNYIEDDLKTTRPAFLGSIVSHYQRVDLEHKKVTNTPIGPKKAWAKLVAILAVLMLIVVIGYFAYEQGAFDSLTGMFSGFGDFSMPTFTPPSLPSSTDIMSKYPTPEALKAAIDRGEVSYNSLPSDVKKMVDNVKTPTVSP